MENKSIRPVDSDTIMVPTDFTEAAENALKHALMLAKIFSKKVDLLHVVADGRSASNDEDKALQTMKEMAVKFNATSGIKIDYWVRRGNIFDSIGEFADEIDGWIIDELKAIGCDTAKSVLEIGLNDLVKRTDLEEETIKEVISILKAEFE